MIDNPYWDLVTAKGVSYSDVWDAWVVGHSFGSRPIESMSDSDFIEIGAASMWRLEQINRFCFTIPSPDTVAFIARHAGPRVLDPMAGTGYWAWLLTQHGIDVLAYDLNPPSRRGNFYHTLGTTYAQVHRGYGPWTTKHRGRDRTLLLSWPPIKDPIGAQILASYRGSRVIYIGEIGGCCGDDHLFDLLHDHFTPIAHHIPVQYESVHDVVVICDRK